MFQLNPPVYTNRFGMDEYQQDSFIHAQIEEFCDSILRHKNQANNENLYTLLYEYIEDNLEKFIPEKDYENN